ARGCEIADPNPRRRARCARQPASRRADRRSAADREARCSRRPNRFRRWRCPIAARTSPTFSAGISCLADSVAGGRKKLLLLFVAFTASWFTLFAADLDDQRPRGHVADALLERRIDQREDEDDVRKAHEISQH